MGVGEGYAHNTGEDLLGHQGQDILGRHRGCHQHDLNNENMLLEKTRTCLTARAEKKESSQPGLSLWGTAFPRVLPLPGRSGAIPVKMLNN